MAKDWASGLDLERYILIPKSMNVVCSKLGLVCKQHHLITMVSKECDIGLVRKYSSGKARGGPARLRHIGLWVFR